MPNKKLGHSGTKAGKASQPVPKKPTIKALQEQISQAKFKSELALHEMQAQISHNLKESNLAYSPPIDVINFWDQFYDGQKLLFPIYPSRLDYRTSSSYIFLSESQLDLLRVYSRWTYEMNSIAKGILKGLANFIIKNGFRYEVQPRRDENPSPGLIKKCQKVLDEFQQKNKWHLRQREFFLRSRRDGEYFVRFFPSDDCCTEVRVIEPECIRSPHALPEWTFGIKAPPEDRENVELYHLTYLGGNDPGEDVEPAEIVHTKVNTDLGVKRGLSDFFCTHEMLSNVAKLTRAEMLGESVRTSIAYVREFAQASADSVTALQQANTDWFIPEPAFGSARMQPVKKIEPGSVVDVPTGLKMIQPPTANSAVGIAILDAALQQLAQYWNMPSFMVKGDSSSSSFASALSEESPFTLSIETEQYFYSEEFKSIMLRVLKIAIAQEELPEDALEQIDVQVICPSIVSRQTEKQSQRFMLLHDKGIMSKRTWSNKENLDYEHEQASYKEDEGGPPPDVMVKPEEPGQPGQQQQQPSGLSTQQPNTPLRRK